MYQRGRAWIELDMDCLAHNVRELKKLLPPECTLMPAIKANAYGHGAVLVGKTLQNLGIRDFCVASVSEGIRLRRAGITGQILILGYTHPASFLELSRWHLTQTAVDYPYACALSAFGHPLLIHVGIDTGMHRLGVSCENFDLLLKIWKLPNLNITGVFSHLCVPEGRTEKERNFTLTQIARYRFIVDALHQNGISGFKTHLQGSYGVLNYPALQFDYARVGLALYGVLGTSQSSIAADIPLLPILSLKARIVCIKTLRCGDSLGYGLAFTAHTDLKIAVVSIGYADGLPRELSNKGHALVHGHKVPIIGRICMDQLFLDVSTIPETASGDEAVFIGVSGDEEISAGCIAEEADSISNEILSRLGERLERFHA